MSDALSAAARTAIGQCLGVGSEESVVVVTDDEREPIGEAMYDAAAAVTDDVTLLRYPPRDQTGTEPPAPVAAAMAERDVFVPPTAERPKPHPASSAAGGADGRG